MTLIHRGGARVVSPRLIGFLALLLVMVLVTVGSALAALPANSDVDIVYQMERSNSVTDVANNASQAGTQNTVIDNGISGASGKLGNATTFVPAAQTSDCVYQQDASYLWNSSGATWCAWARTTTEANAQWLFSMGGEGGNPGPARGGPGLAYYGADDEFRLFLSDGASANTLMGGPLTQDTWHFICLTADTHINGDYRLFVDGTKTGTWQSGKNLAGVQDRNLAVGCYTDDGAKDRSGWTGQIDSFLVFEGQLSNSTITSLYNGGSGSAYPWTAGSSPPVVTVYGPDEGQVTSNTTVRFSYTADEPDSGGNMTVTLYINGTKNVTAEITNTTAIHEINESFVAGEYQFVLEVADGSDTTNSSDYNFTVDFTEPPQTKGVNSNVELDNSTWWNIHLHGDSIVVNFNTSDPELFRYDLNITAPNGSVEYTHTANDLNVTEYNKTFTINVSTPGTGYVGQYNVSLLTADGHTAHFIESIPYETTSNSVTFTYPNGVTCKFESEEANLKGLAVEHSTDRMNWTIETNSAKTEHGFVLDCSSKIVPFNRLPYPSFVIYPAWFDFAVRGEPPDEYVVNKLDPTKYSINIKYAENQDKIEFSSTGLVNINGPQAYYFTTSKTPVAPPNTSTDAIEANTIFFNWTAGTGASFYEVMRDGTNVANTTNLYYNFTGLSTATTYELGARSVYNDSDITFYVNGSGSFQNVSTSFNGTLSVEVRNEVTNDRLVGPLVFINLLGTTVNVTGNTTTGLVTLINISSDNYTIRHSSIGWGTRDQYLEIGENDTGSIIVYLLNDTVRDPGRVFVRDTQSDPVNETVLKLLRYFDDENLYRVVEMSTTNDEGVAVMSAQANDAFYKWFVEYQGQTKITITIPEFLSLDDDNIWRRSFTINIGRDFWESWRSETNDAHVVNFTNSTRTLAYAFNDPDGIVTRGCIRARWANATRWQTVGPSCVTGSSGVALLTLPAVNNTFFWTAYVDTNTLYTEEVETASGTVDGSSFPAFQRPGVRFLSLLLYLGAIGLFAFNAILGAIVAGVLFGVITWLELFPFAMGTAIGAITITIGLAVYAMRRT